MIDTIKLAYPYDERLANILEQYKIKLQKLSPDGSIIWSKEWIQDHLPSHFAGLRIMFQKSRDLKDMGFRGCPSLIYFEFSLQKWISSTGYNNKNTELDYDIQVLDMWFKAISDFTGYDFDFAKFTVYRIDLAQNFILEGNLPVEDFLRALEIKFSRHTDGEKVRRYPGALYYGSRWVTKKIYWKFLEFMQVERLKRAINTDDVTEGGDMAEKGLKTDGFGGLSGAEIKELGRMLRFELSFKRPFLKKNGVCQIYDIQKLRERFEVEKRKYTTVQKLKANADFSNSEYRLIDYCKRYGYNGAKAEFLKTVTDRQFYRIKRSLLTKGVFLECIDNSEWRLDVQTADSQSDYVLRVA